MIHEKYPPHKTIFAALLNARKTHGNRHIIAEDSDRQPLNYMRLIQRSFILGRLIERHTANEQTIGIMLPNSVGAAITFFALQAYNRTPAMINFTAGDANMIAACRTAQVRVILTSRRFIAVAKMEATIVALETAGIRILHLEDLRKTLTPRDKLHGVAASLWPERAYRKSARAPSPKAPAVILFTSGSEGAPKGVALSHRNLLSNLQQITARLDFTTQDKMFSCLPMFHAFGLTAGTLLTCLHGIRTFYYPSPLHYKTVVELIHDTQSTLFFSTDTFLNGYAQCAKPHELRSLRGIYAGAEKLKDTTRQHYAEAYGVTVFQGYGVTETAPVIAVNTHTDHRTGTVGQFMPDIEWKLEAVEGITEGGQLWVKGPNIMAGYLHADAPGQIHPPQDGWHNTGDIVAVDDEGFITILGRTKRFAKIGGEMISLTSVENTVSDLWPDHKHAVISIPDARKGEQIGLMTEYAGATRAGLISHFKAVGLPELHIPRHIHCVDVMPLLGSGKVDYIKLKDAIK